ncbi:rab GTPase-activating protein 1-like isoform X2 [Culicoides brevitarsis]|uniref:rab GTPase-activating protein 1-like isoform X2 n=1 Tax=Culicoides brevitarsis TaxID=469753 RepID=UPI00307CC53D
MEDNLSIKSSDSEYEIVPETPALNISLSKDEVDTTKMDEGRKEGVIPISPVLNIAANGDIQELEKNLTEVIKECDVNEKEDASDALSSSTTLKKPALCLDNLPVATLETKNVQSPNSLTTPDPNKVGQSVFYDCMDASPAGETTPGTKTKERSDTDDEEVSDIDQECTKFSAVTYLGAVNINAPKSESEIRRKMSEMNALCSNTGIDVSISVPNGPEGVVVLYDNKNSVVSTYQIQRILFYTPGPADTADSACFAFTWSHGTAQDAQIFQCHVFRCQIPEAITRVNSCFYKAFNRLSASMTCSVTSTAATSENAMVTSICSDMTGNPLSQAMYEFNVSLEIREKVAKNSYSAVARDKNVFKLRCNVDKEVCIVVKQVPSGNLPPLLIERCFGVLLSPGKLIRQADMRLLDMAHMGYLKVDGSQLSPALAPYQVQAEWKANEKAFEILNAESPKKYVTVAVDLVIKGISEPVRFVIETMVTIASQNESRLMDNLLLSKRPLLQKFYLQLKDSAGSWEVQSIDPSEEIIEVSQSGTSLRAFTKNLSKMVRSQSALSFDFDDITDLTEGDCLSDTDEPLLSGTGEVSKECSVDCLEEWSLVLQEWETNKRPKALPALVRAGIPEALRCRVWQKLAGTENATELMERYRILITKETSCETVIQRDLNRTFPAHKFFKDSGGLGQDSLYKVSKAYAVHDAEIGYCQGLSFISASLLLHMPEEEAFAVLVAFMYDYKLRDLYKLGFEALYLRLYQLNRLLKEQLPDLWDHFEANGVETHMFASQWFLTLFTARFPLCFVFHVLDLFLLDGQAVLFQVAMTLLYICKKDLLELDFEGILKYIRVSLPKKCRSEAQTRKLMKMVCEWKIKKLKKYEDEYRIQKQEEEREQAALKYYEEKFDEERKMLQTEIELLKSRLQETEKQERQGKNIISDYKQIIQRQEQQINKLTTMVEEVTKVVGNCTKCSSSMPQHSPLHKPLPLNGLESEPATEVSHPLDPLHEAQQRIRELELELAKTKLDKVEAECRNQDLNHKLTTISEIHQKSGGATGTGPASWQPWLSKTLNTIQEKVNTTKRDIPTFQAHVPLEGIGIAASEKNSQNRHSFDVAKLSNQSSGTTNKDPEQ